MVTGTGHHMFWTFVTTTRYTFSFLFFVCIFLHCCCLWCRIASLVRKASIVSISSWSTFHLFFLWFWNPKNILKLCDRIYMLCFNIRFDFFFLFVLIIDLKTESSPLCLVRFFSSWLLFYRCNFYIKMSFFMSLLNISNIKDREKNLYTCK